MKTALRRKSEANLNAKLFCQWVNNDLLPSSDLQPNLPRMISVRTATCWLHRLGFRKVGHKKGAYVDAHKREDVVAHRREYLDMMKALRDTHLPPPLPSDEHPTTPPPDAETRKKLVLIYHDESIFNTNEGQQWFWGTGDEPYIQPKPKVLESWYLILLTSTMAIYSPPCMCFRFKLSKISTSPVGVLSRT